ncbi:MAG TPA: DUF6691 family protein [Cytophagales bacterium]|nr:DUF6691 family protein [Cytophagales bacterium]
MRNSKYLFTGIFFGIALVKSGIISWFRIQEMFRFQSFHLFGVIGTAIITGIISVQIIKRFNLKSMEGQYIKIMPKTFHKGHVFGSLIFGIGWVLTGACPGPMLAQISYGYPVVLITFLSAIAGTWTYGYFRKDLPH